MTTQEQLAVVLKLEGESNAISEKLGRARAAVAAKRAAAECREKANKLEKTVELHKGQLAALKEKRVSIVNMILNLFCARVSEQLSTGGAVIRTEESGTLRMYWDFNGDGKNLRPLESLSGGEKAEFLAALAVPFQPDAKDKILLVELGEVGWDGPKMLAKLAQSPRQVVACSWFDYGDKTPQPWVVTDLNPE